MKQLATIYVEGFRRVLRFLVFTLLFKIAGLPALFICFLLFRAFGYDATTTVSFSDAPILCWLLIALSVLYIPFALYFVSEICQVFKSPLFTQNKSITET